MPGLSRAVGAEGSVWGIDLNGPAGNSDATAASEPDDFGHADLFQQGKKDLTYYALRRSSDDDFLPGRNSFLGLDRGGGRLANGCSLRKFATELHGFGHRSRSITMADFAVFDSVVMAVRDGHGDWATDSNFRHDDYVARILCRVCCDRARLCPADVAALLPGASKAEYTRPLMARLTARRPVPV